jgi:Mn2+/Fe2+ NRAMP family transporter
MGDHANTRIFNVIAWITVLVMIGLTAGWFWSLRGSG